MALRLKINDRKNESDELLLSRYLETGDPYHLGLLYKRYMYMVYGVCLKYLKNRESSEDAVTGIFEKLIGEESLAKVKNFRSWLYVITRNYCLMELRSMKREKEKLEEMTSDNNPFMENHTELHPIDKRNNNIDKALENCIDNLKEEQKKCVRLFYYDNKCYSEIALIMKIDEKKVKSYLQNGKRNLKICLESVYEEEE